MVREMPAAADPSLLVGLAPFDDAAIYEMAPGVALVSTTDFFPPLVDHPSDFGAIAAANACSDVFAMGGRVAIAVNIAAFPENFPREAIVAIFDAAAEVVTAAGGTIAGGHTIRNPEPIFGLAVQGVVDPARVFRKGGGRPGDVLMLSKPIGTGLALAGGSADDKAAAIAGMRGLNRAAHGTLE
jgi:selenide,water dikinase